MLQAKQTILCGLGANRSKCEHITKLLGAPQEFGIEQQITYLSDKNIISKALGKLLNSVRLNGNIALHEMYPLMQQMTLADVQEKLILLHDHEQVLHHIEMAIHSIEQVRATHSCVQMTQWCFDLPKETRETVQVVLPGKEKEVAISITSTTTTTTAPPEKKRKKKNAAALSVAKNAAIVEASMDSAPLKLEAEVIVVESVLHSPEKEKDNPKLVSLAIPKSAAVKKK